MVKITLGPQSWPTRFPMSSFPKICRNDQSLTIWTPNCNKLHVFDMVEEMKRKKFNKILFLCTKEISAKVEAKVNSFCMCK